MLAPLGGASLSGVAPDSVEPGVSAQEISDVYASIDSGDSRTQQQFVDELDVNVIVRRFGVTAQVAVDQMGVYADFRGITDYWSAQERIDGARARFMELPPEVRERFGNDPGYLIEAATQLPAEDFAKLMDPPKAVEPPAPPPPSAG